MNFAKVFLFQVHSKRQNVITRKIVTCKSTPFAPPVSQSLNSKHYKWIRFCNWLQACYVLHYYYNTIYKILFDFQSLILKDQNNQITHSIHICFNQFDDLNLSFIFWEFCFYSTSDGSQILVVFLWFSTPWFSWCSGLSLLLWPTWPIWLSILSHPF